MAQITLKGNPIRTSGELPPLGAKAPDFRLTRTDLADITPEDFIGKKVVLNIFPSIDTPVCSVAARRFNTEIGRFDNAVVICASRDLPFALARFCAAEGLTHVIPASELRALTFGEAYGVRILDGPLNGLLARAVLVLDTDGTVIHRQLVPEIAQEPDYAAALAAL
jgi:thiol peroxidase